jgi:endonuclease/exonuclease/phosphatase (EEP) superfamily protein YafD
VSPPAPAAPAPIPDGPRFTIATYNVYADAPGDPATIDAIRRTDADVVFLQETTAAWEAPLRRALGRAYPHAAFRAARDRFGGLAVLSRVPFDEGAVLRPDAGPFPAWLVEVESPLGRLAILNLHLFPPVRWRERGWLRAYLDSQVVHVREVAGFLSALAPRTPALIVGDLNEAAGGDAVRTLEAAGYRGALDPSVPTWRWTTDHGPVALQLDHILHTAELALVTARVIEAGRSDHLPVVATFARAAASP